MIWHVAMRPGQRRRLNLDDPHDQRINEVEWLKASVRAKVEHPFRLIKRQFGHMRVRCQGLKKNTHQLHTLFALANLWMVRAKLAGAQG